MLQAHKITHDYGNHRALHSLELTVEAGDVLCLLGPNGAGKTTTIQIFLGFLRPTRGFATVDHHRSDVDTVAARRALAYIPELVHLYPNLSGLENLNYLCQLGGLKLTTAEAATWLNKAGLEEKHHSKRVSGYSKGMRQKVGIALASARGVRNFLLDEPTSGLDPGAAHDFTEILHSLREQGSSILMATHDLYHVKQSGTKVAILDSGRLLEYQELKNLSLDELHSLYLKSRTPTVEAASS